MSDIILLVGFFLAGALVYRFRAPILARLRRFDARNAARRAEEIRDRHDRFAHYRRTVLTAEESLEQVAAVTVYDERTGQPLTRYRFLGELFETRNEAETARRMRAIAIAREFYAELDGKTLPREAHSADEPPNSRPTPQLTQTTNSSD